jgi:hypothetical protein
MPSLLDEIVYGGGSCVNDSQAPGYEAHSLAFGQMGPLLMSNIGICCSLPELVFHPG